MSKNVNFKECKDLNELNMPSAEQLSFDFDFVEKEHLAPVSAIYKKFINTMMEEAIKFAEVIDKRVFVVNVMNLTEMLKNDELFKKCSKQFQQEVHDFLALPFESIYRMSRGREYVPREDGMYGTELPKSEDENVNRQRAKLDIKSNGVLKLVK